MNAAYAFHFNAGKQFESVQDWTGALKEFQKAADLKSTLEVTAAVKSAAGELETAANKNGAAVALQKSELFEGDHQDIQAYEVLANLPESQRSLVSADMERLAPAYVKAAVQTARQIEQAHDPIRGLADELEMERAHRYLQNAYALTNDPNLKDRIADLADRLSEYYLQQGKRYFGKPLASGAGIGWSYLEKALQYRASNLDAVRDAMTSGASAYQMRSRLSVRVVFRDQTSRRDSAGFAEQLADAIATGLETSGLPVTVIRPGESPAFEPNFQIVGDVIQHRRALVSTSVPKDSKYLAGEQEMPNDKWNQANREYEAAGLELQRAQTILEGLLANHKKKEAAGANSQVVALQQKVETAHLKLDSIPSNIPLDIVRPYTYTEKTIELAATVELQFRLSGSSENQVYPMLPITREANQKFTQFENVKPEDTEGVKVQGTIPDDILLLTDVENGARDALIKAVKESVAGLPEKIFEQANKRAKDGDLDGGAESYILYLNSVAASQSTERQAAEHFLLDQYNIRWP